MKSDTPSARVWLDASSCNLDAFAAETGRTANPADYPHADKIISNIPVYDGNTVRRLACDPGARPAMLAEWVEILMDGPGIVVFTQAFADTAPIDAASKLFFAIIAEQHSSGQAAGDHFARPGANDRVWNALEKLALRDPAVFAAYYSNEIIALVSEAWLGPGYQITSQLNVVNPGGAAQSAHRDYHMGFQSPAEIARFPAHVHRLSPVLTLQGAVAHVDMPVETGPTLYLPWSQRYLPGYFAPARPEFQDYFDKHHVQLALAKGDAVFFNPALLHAAGANRTGHVKRMANLLQVSSAYGRAIESVDRARMCRALYPTLRTLKNPANAVAACAEAYPFPTNLDRDPPLGGLAPPSQAQLLHQALAGNWEPDAFARALEQHSWKRLA